MICIHLAQDIQQANLIIHLLEQNNVQAIILNQYTQGAMGELPFTQAYPEIWVDEKLTNQASKLIKKFEQLPLSENTVYCEKCHEVNPENFETCWACGTNIEL